MTDAKDPYGMETIRPAFGGPPSWDPEIRQKQQVYLYGIGSDRDLDDEHAARLHGMQPASPPPDLSGAAAAIAILAVPMPILFPPGYAGYLTWQIALWYGWHTLFAIGTGLATFVVALALWTLVVVSIPRFFWILSGLALGGGFGAHVASVNRLDAVWTGFAAFCAGAFVALWFWGLWAFLARMIGVEHGGTSKVAIAGSIGVALLPPALFGSAILYAASLPRRSEDPRFETFLSYVAIAAVVLFVAVLVRFGRHLTKGELAAAVFDGLTIVSSAFLFLIAAPQHVASWLGYSANSLNDARFIVDHHLPVLLGWLTVAVAFGFVVRRFAVRNEV